MGFLPLLNELRVVDAAGRIGAYAGRLLADLGAEVVKVEAPQGDPERTAAPIVDLNGYRSSAVWEFLSANKRRLVADWASEDGSHRMRELLSRADVFIESTMPGELDAAGLGFEQLSALRPGLVHVSVTPFGSWDARAAHLATDLTLFAASGYLRLCGDPDRSPLRVSWPLTDVIAGAEAAAGALMGLCAARRTGRSQRVDVSAHRALLWLLYDAHRLWDATGLAPRRSGRARFRPATNVELPIIWPTADGYLVFWLIAGVRDAVGLVGQGTMPTLLEWMRAAGYDPGPLADVDWSAFDYDSLDQPRLDRLIHQITTFFARRSRAEILSAVRRYGVMCWPVDSLTEVLQSEQLAARRFWVSIEHHGGQLRRFPGFFALASGLELAQPRPAPKPDEDVEVDWERRFAGDEGTSDDRPPLDGLRVLELSLAVAGPLTCRYLADGGATVVKIEATSRPDVSRTQPPPQFYANLNAGKLGLSLNLRHPKAGEVMERLVRWADVIVDSLSAGVLERLGWGHEALQRANPRAVLVKTTGWGSAGPNAKLRTYGYMLNAAAGLTSLLGWPDRGPVAEYGVVSDIVVARMQVTLLLAAVVHSRHTGQGIALDVSQYEALLTHYGPALLAAAAGGRIPGCAGNADADMAPHGVYPCLGDDEWCALSVANDESWVALCRTIGREDMANDPTLQTAGGRRRAADELDKAVADWTRQRTPYEAESALQAIGVPAAAVARVERLIAEQGLGRDGTFTPVSHTPAGKILIQSLGIRTSPNRLRQASPAPELGEHTAFVCTSLLGLSDEDFAQLLSEGVFD